MGVFGLFGYIGEGFIEITGGLEAVYSHIQRLMDRQTIVSIFSCIFSGRLIKIVETRRLAQN